MAETGAEGGEGYFALDEITSDYAQTECGVLPREAIPKGGNINHCQNLKFKNYIHFLTESECDFEMSYCAWNVMNPGRPFAWHRTYSQEIVNHGEAGKTAPTQYFLNNHLSLIVGPSGDRDHSITGFFLIAQAEKIDTFGETTRLSSPFKAEFHREECLTFWYDIEDQGGIGKTIKT